MALFARLGTEVDEATRQQIVQGKRLQAVLTQPPHQPMTLSEQVVVFYAVQQGLLEDRDVGQVSDFESRLLAFFHEEHGEMMEEIELKRDLTGEMRDRLAELLDEFLQLEQERSADA